MEQSLIYVNDDRLRAGLVLLQDKTDKLNEIFDAEILVQPSYFNSEIKLETGTTAYSLPTITNEVDKSAFPLTRVVNYNDVFIGLKRQVTIDHRATTDEANIFWQTYYNKQIFTTTNTVVPDDLQSIYSSLWDYQVGSRTFVQNQSLRLDLCQPRTQQSSANNYPEYDGANMPDQTPYIVISGKSTNYLRIKISKKGFQGGAIDGQGVNVLTWFMRGFTLQNGSGFVRFYTGDESIENYYDQYIEKNKGNDPDKMVPLPKSDAFANME